MKKYIIKYGNDNKVDCIPCVYNTLDEATDALSLYFINHSFFPFRIQECDLEIDECIRNFSEARDTLGLKDNNIELETRDYYIINDPNIKRIEYLAKKVNLKHLEALIALNELFTIAEAWNKEDNFVPDFSNKNQYKYFPWFIYNNDSKKFIFGNITYTIMMESGTFGPKLYFKSESRAEQFVYLYNKVFLLNK